MFTELEANRVIRKRPFSEIPCKNKKKSEKESIANKYSRVADSRQELLEIQLENARLEKKIKEKELEFITNKMKHDQEQHDIDLKIKMLQYQKLLENN